MIVTNATVPFGAGVVTFEIGARWRAALVEPPDNGPLTDLDRGGPGRPRGPARRPATGVAGG